jgi:hypothetical protein
MMRAASPSVKRAWCPFERREPWSSTEGLGPRKSGHGRHIAKERELLPRIELDGDIVGGVRHARQAAMARSPITRR